MAVACVEFRVGGGGGGRSSDQRELPVLIKDVSSLCTCVIQYLFECFVTVFGSDCVTMSYGILFFFFFSFSFFLFSNVALRTQRPDRLLGTGSSGRPPRLSHSS